MKTLKKVFIKTTLVMTILLLIFVSTGCNNKSKGEDLLNISYEEKGNEQKLAQYDTKNPVVAMYIKDYGSIVIELYPSVAPNTVSNFATLVKEGFYDDNTFHRLVPGFVLQGGDPTGSGTGGPDYTIKGEFAANKFKNDLKHEKYVVSMARTSVSYDTAGSQFFIVLEDSNFLDGEYAAFGKVIDGFDNLDRIVEEAIIEDENSGKLQSNLKIKKTIIDMKDNKLNAVEKIKK